MPRKTLYVPDELKAQMEAVGDEVNWSKVFSHAAAREIEKETEAMLARKSLHYAVDLDGTLAVYDRWRGHTHIGEPIQPMVDRVKQLLADGHYVTIFTARLAGADFVAGQAAAAVAYGKQGPDFTKLEEIINTIEEWCRMHIGQVLPITAEKKPYFHAFLDDRAEQILPNDGRNAALAYRALAEKCLQVMEASQLDPIILRQTLTELDLKLMRDKETP